jgi:hypothetical protein
MARPGTARSLSLPLAALLAGTLALAGCQRSKSSDLEQLQQRQEQLQLQIQQLEQRFNATTPRDGSDRQGKPPAGAVKSITFRSGTGDDRLRIYWADGSTSDLPCTKEQTTTVCG